MACGGVELNIHAFFILYAVEKCHVSTLHPDYFSLREIFHIGQFIEGSVGPRPG
jgi:hypothetical protein